MKNLITTIASMIIITSFISQIVVNEETYLRLFITDAIIDKYSEEWNEEGTVSSESEIRLKEEIAEYTNGKAELISVSNNADSSEIYDVKLIYKDVIGPKKLIGFNGDDSAERVRKVFVSSRVEQGDEEENEQRKEANGFKNEESENPEEQSLKS